jgi:nucleoside-diphosphate-sugar epimerase
MAGTPRALGHEDSADPGEAVEGVAVSLAEHLASRRGFVRTHHAVVIGATGYVGRRLVEVLRAAGEQVTAHIRPKSPREALAARFEARGATVDRTPLEATALAQRFAAIVPTHVFLCHGTTRATSRAQGIGQPYETVDVGVTATVIEASRGLPEPPRLVLLSAMGAGGPGAYLAARGRAEDLVRSSGLPFTLCRAPLLTGPDRDERRPLEHATAALLRPTMRLADALGLRRLAARYSPMDAREAAEGLARSGFHHMTIDRVVLADELRKVGVYERERWHPRSARDEGRH